MAAATVIAALVSLGTATPSSATPLLTNGGFETGDLTGWSFSGGIAPFVTSGPFHGIGGPQSGTYWAALGNVGCCGTLSQSVSVITTPGQTLRLSYWLAGDGSASYFDAFWNTSQIAGSVETDYGSGGDYTHFEFSLIATGSDTLTFNERDDLAYLGLDNVQLSVPEPGTLGLLGTALIGFLGVARRKRKSAA